MIEIIKNTIVWTRRDITIGHDIYESKLKIKDIEKIIHYKWFGNYRIFSSHIKTIGIQGLEKEDKHTINDVDECGNRYRPLKERLNINSIETDNKEIIEKITSITGITVEEI